MMPGNFGITQRDVRSFAAHDHTRLGERMTLPLRRAGKNAENHFLGSRQLESRIGRGQSQIRTGGIGTGEGRKRGHDHGLVDFAFDLNDRAFPAFRTLELYFRMLAKLRVFEQMLCTTMNTSSFHDSKVAPLEWLRRLLGAFLPER